MQKQISFKGEPLYFEQKGKGKTIVLLHGFLGSSALWDKQSSRLAKRYRLVCIELPGHGNSAPLGYNHTMELMAEAIKAVLDALRIRKALLVGHSLGGYIALAFAEAYPDKVRGLILINSTAKGDSSERKESRDRLINLMKKNKDQALRALVPSFFAIKQRGRHWHVKKYLQWARACSLQGIVATLEGMKIRKEREIVLKFAPYPYLNLIGESDPLFLQEDLKNEAKLGEFGNYEIIEDASHMIPLEKPEACLKWIMKFEKQL